MRWNLWTATSLLTFAACFVTGCSTRPSINQPEPHLAHGGVVVPPLHKADAATPKPAELPPDKSAELCLAVAQEYDKAGRDADAIFQYERARKLNPKLEVSRRLAVLYDRSGETGKALVEYRAALEAHPRDAGLLNDFGYFHLVRDNFAEAERYLRAALEINPRQSRAWVNLGMALGYQKRFAESYEAFARAVSPAEAYYNVGLILTQWTKEEPEHKEEARKALRQALACDPNMHKAQTLLAFLDDPASLPNDPFARKLKPSRSPAKPAHPAGNGPPSASNGRASTTTGVMHSLRSTTAGDLSRGLAVDSGTQAAVNFE
jgi:Tfp pilus assembly protein PilF